MLSPSPQDPQTEIAEPILIAAYTAIVVTFRRPESLYEVLTGIGGQSARPQLVVVVDNAPEGSARSVVAAFTENYTGRVIYIQAPHNLGAAGGWALAAEHAAAQRDRGEWLLVVDDDDAFGHPALVERLLATTLCLPTAESVAAVGLRGAQLGRTGRLRRCVAPEASHVRADYLASNGVPLYRWVAIDGVGFFDPDLFFGFEDLDLGIRLRDAGWAVYSIPFPSLHTVADTSSERSVWREYFKIRALVWIARRRVGWLAVASTIVRSVLGGGLLLAIRDRRPSLAIARVQGACDALLGRMGPAGHAPAGNLPKTVTQVEAGPSGR